MYGSWIYDGQMPLLAFYCNASLLPQRGKETAEDIRDMLRELGAKRVRGNAIYVITRGHKEGRKEDRKEGSTPEILSR